MYLQGFGNHHQTEAKKGALPKTQNSPQNCPFDLFAEQISGTAFTKLRSTNLHSWLYRMLPTAAQGPYTLYPQNLVMEYTKELSPNAERWSPIARESGSECDFIEGLFHVAGNHITQAYTYQCTKSMHNKYFANNDGELLFVPYSGKVHLHTEMGILFLKPGMIAIIPRGIKFKVELLDSETKGYLCENSASPLALPQLGILGANALANPRHFNYPIAAFEQTQGPVTILCKNKNRLWQAKCDHSPLNVVAWSGNYAPYSYDLSLFNTINTVSFDHPDPSIFTVLTSDSDTPGVANLDFVIFPPRWMVAEHSFRPPYFHRNVMNELMGLVEGQYDAKQEGFVPGGISIHNCMTPHGPDLNAYQQASTQELKPEKYQSTLAFMFETKESWHITEQAMNNSSRQQDYLSCWQGFKNNFKA